VPYEDFEPRILIKISKNTKHDNILLQGVTGKEFSIGFRDAPIQFTKEATWLGFGKEMHLTVEYIKQRILSRCNVEFPVEKTGIKLGNDLIGSRNWVAAVVGLLWHATHIADDAFCTRQKWW